MRQCPRCQSDELIYQRRGSDVVNGYVASRAFGPMGWLAANVGADNIIATCAECENQFEFTPSRPQEPSTLFQIGQGIAKAIVVMITFLVMAGILKALTFLMDLFK